MKTISATALARNLRQVLDDLARTREEVRIERHGRVVGRLVPEFDAPEFNLDEQWAIIDRIAGSLSPQEGVAMRETLERIRDLIDPRDAPWEFS